MAKDGKEKGFASRVVNNYGKGSLAIREKEIPTYHGFIKLQRFSPQTNSNTADNETHNRSRETHNRIRNIATLSVTAILFSPSILLLPTKPLP